MLAYKVFQKTRLPGKGVTLHPFLYNYCYTYSREGKNVPREGWGPFGCFDTLFHAKAFLYGMYKPEIYFVIFEVDIEKSTEDKMWRNKDEFAGYGGSQDLLTLTFFGTILADSVTLGKVVYGFYEKEFPMEEKDGVQQ